MIEDPRNAAGAECNEKGVKEGYRAEWHPGEQAPFLGPEKFVKRGAGTLVKETMNNLVDLGEKMGADPSSWSNEPPTF